MNKGTIEEGLKLLDTHKKAEVEYKQSYQSYMNWYCANMPKQAVASFKISQFVIDYAIPIVAIGGFIIGFAFGYSLGIRQ